MKIILTSFFILIRLSQMALGQTYILESSEISFFSEAPLENIHAITKEARSIFKPNEDAQIAFQIPINSFQFKKALMQEHFNENYMESEKFPYATFSGKITPYNNLPGKKRVSAIGKLTIHGVTHDVSIDGALEQKDGVIHMMARFPVRLKDYDITIPKVVFMKIAEVVEVDVAFRYKKK